MNILALETSGDYCSAALWRGGVVDAREMPADKRQSGMLIDMMHGLLRSQNMTLAQMDGIAYGAGPGSFTGLRIACGVVQGLAIGSGKPVAGIGTLLALAQSQDNDRVVCCVDARMDEVYHAAYERRAAAWTVVHEPGVYRPGEVPPLSGNGWHGCGNGFAVHGDILRDRYLRHLESVDARAHPRAREIAELGARVFAAGGGQPAEQAAPVYVRNRVALKISERV